jgi:predicted SAM-dependent methyltransferase
MNRLLLGSGDWHWPGWTTVDADPASGADFISAIPPLPEDVCFHQWDTIMAIHFIEHIPPWQAETLLRQCYSILAPFGVLILEQPDICYAARSLLGMVEPPQGAQPGQFDMWALYGDPTHRNEYWLHRWGYTPQSMVDLLRTCGFTLIEVKPAQYHQPVRDFRVEAVKS